MRTKADTRLIVERLKKEYPVSECSLAYDDAWQLLVSVRLSAQCTDARVNIVTKDLFAKYPTLEALAAAGPDAIEAIIKPCGLGKSQVFRAQLPAADQGNCRGIQDRQVALCPETGGAVKTQPLAQYQRIGA